MNLPGLLLVALLLISPDVQAGEISGKDTLLTATSYSLVGSNEWRESQDRLDQQPSWNPLAAPVPFSPAEAAVAAQRAMERQLPDIKEWTVWSLALQSVGTGAPQHWFYRVEMRPAVAMPEWMEQNERRLTVVLLLDGTVVPAQWTPHRAAGAQPSPVGKKPHGRGR